MGKYANQSVVTPTFSHTIIPWKYDVFTRKQMGLPNQVASPFGPQILQLQLLNQFINKSNAPSTPPSHILRNQSVLLRSQLKPLTRKKQPQVQKWVTETLTEAVMNSVLTSKLPLVQSLGIDNFFVKKKSTTKHPPTLKEICKGLKKENELMKERMNYYDETFAMLLEKVNGSNVDDLALHLRKSSLQSHSGSLNSAPTSNPVICKHATSASSSSTK
ncbi:hypothetical protein HK096_005749, partial [Nowakowskiella sp. JEL0078]